MIETVLNMDSDVWMIVFGVYLVALAIILAIVRP